ncbi:MAG TPA: 3-hydroxyacyl-CoA dehydrogenase NAD-binding domain-containing protein [Candidatus Acidoferrales bacterium]|nr:3-hydroxyacyl-CoA dehydrogenase NAD-binding domain-containing protein [Candidatus Acidoferrales bacterium]
MIDYQVESDGIAVIRWKATDRAANILNAAWVAEFTGRVEEAIRDPRARGVILTSAGPDFVSGVDLTELARTGDPAPVKLAVRSLDSVLRAIETCGKPFVAAVNGSALGEGFEICLACHHRICADDPNSRIGLPQVQLGLLPGAGGTQRLPRLIGIRNALPLLLEGKTLRPGEAKDAGPVDKLVSPAELLTAARSWILGLPEGKASQPWDAKGFRVPGGASTSSAGFETFSTVHAMVRERTRGLYPAALAILSCVFEGCTVDFATGLKIEASYFVNVLDGPQARNIVRASFAREELSKLAARPKSVPAQSYTKIGVLGAGMMGAAIAYVSAGAGLDVTLLDTTQDNADRGKGYSAKLLNKLSARGQLNAEAREKFLARISPTTNYADLKGCQLVIEAVFENREIKADVTRRTESAVGAGILFASNTSTLPITGLAQAWSRPENFIGLHFFSPVDRMPLLEVIRGRRTSEECLARALDFAKRIGKTPIVVNDSRGFYTSRVFSTFVNEGLAMLVEGVAPALIENAGRMAGMPVGPLAQADEVSLDLMQSVRKQTMADLGAAYRPSVGNEVFETMVEKLGRLGRKVGKGFYDYPVGGKKKLWPDLSKHFSTRSDQPSVEELIERFLYVQSVESVRCLEEGVIGDPRDADVGSVLGWGFCPPMGGTIGHIETVGITSFLAQCEKLEKAHGERFAPPQLLRDMAARGESFYPSARNNRSGLGPRTLSLSNEAASR